MRVAAAGALAAALVGALPSDAVAQTTIGQTQTPPANIGFCTLNISRVQALSEPPAYAVPPGDWLLTSWSHRAGTLSATQSLKLKLFRPLGDPATTVTYEVIGEDGPRSLTQGTLNTLAVAPPIPVQGGDRLGLVPTAGMVECAFESVAPGDLVRRGSGDTPVGQNMTFTATEGNRLNLSATLDPVPSPLTLDLEAKKQKLRKTLTFFATASADSTLVAEGSVKQTTQQLAANAKTKVKAKLKRSKRKQLAAKLDRSGKAKAKVQGTATDASGATSTDEAKVKLRD